MSCLLTLGYGRPAHFCRLVTFTDDDSVGGKDVSSRQTIYVIEIGYIISITSCYGNITRTTSQLENHQIDLAIVVVQDRGLKKQRENWYRV